MNELIDPRPLEPDWVTAEALPNYVELTVTVTKWNSPEKKWEKKTYQEMGTPMEMLTAILEYVNITSLGEVEDYEITIDGRNANLNTYGLGDRKIHYDLKVPDSHSACLYWTLKEHTSEDQVHGRDLDELFSWIEYLIGENKIFDITIALDDLTGDPDY